MSPRVVYRPRKKIITSYVSEYVDREDLRKLLDMEFRFEEKGAIIFEYYIHVSILILYALFRSPKSSSEIY